MVQYTDLEQVPIVDDEDGSATHVPSAARRSRVLIGATVGSTIVAVGTAIALLSQGTPVLAGTKQAVSFASDVTDDAREFPNIHLVASGYNIFFSDPMPQQDMDSDTVNTDPGLRKPVFAIQYQEGKLTGDRRHLRPDGYFATVDYGCSEVFSTKTVSDDYGLTTERNLEASQTDTYGLDMTMPPPTDGFSFSVGGYGVDTSAAPVGVHAFVGGTGTLSESFKNIRKENILSNNRIVQSNAKCAVYSAGIAYGFPPEIHPEFQQVVKAAGSKQDWWSIFDDFGTHYFSNVKMGARFGSMMIFQKDQYDAMTESVIKAGAEVGPVVEASIKIAIEEPSMTKLASEALPSFKWDPKLKLPDVSLMSAKNVENVTSHASAMVFQGVGPRTPPGGVSMWMEDVSKNPVPLRFTKMVMCTHPGMTLEQRTACDQAMDVYCEEYLQDKGATCSPAERRNCQMDSECESGKVCRSFNCETIPICHVSIFAGKAYSSSEYSLDPVNAVDHPGGKPFNLRLDNWHDKVKSVRLGKGCKKVKLFDDDPGNSFEGFAQDKEFDDSVSSLGRDLEGDVRQIWVWAIDVPGTPPFQPGQGTPPANLAKPTQISFSPQKDALFGEPKPSSGLNTHEGSEFFPNIGKAMYGYNHYHGAPFSSKYAGTDPGFQGRGVWKVSYDSGAVGTEGQWRRIPMSPNARYFVLFASKHPNLKQAQDDGANPTKAAERYLGEKETELKNFLQKMKGGKMEFEEFLHFDERHDKIEFYCEPEVTIDKPSDEYCRLVHGNAQLINQIEADGNEIFSAEREEWEMHKMQMMFGGWRRLQDDARRLLSVGEKYCHEGKMIEWTEADQKREDDEQSAAEAEMMMAWGHGYNSYWRRLGSVNKSVVPARRLDGIMEASSWFSVSEKPNMREFGSLARAKQALRSEATCIGQFENYQECPSGADYDVNTEGTAWAFSGGLYIPGVEHPEDYLAKRFKDEWPRFIVKVVDDAVHSIKQIDGQDQTKGWRTSFDSVIPDSEALNLMTKSLEEYLVANPSDGKTMDSETPVSTKVPDGWKVARNKGGAFCESDFKTDTVSDAHSYEQVSSSSFGIPKTSDPTGDLGISFGLSYEKKETLKVEGNKQEKMLVTQAECGSYHAEIVDLWNNPPETEPSLEFLVGKVEEKKDIWVIFDQYGIDFPTEVVFGARYGLMRYLTQSKFQEYHSSSNKLAIDFGVSVAIPTNTDGVDMTASADRSIGYSATEEETHNSEQYFDERRVFSIGKRLPAGGIDAWMQEQRGEPMPVKFGLMSMCEHPVFKKKKTMCEAAKASYCEEHLQRMHPELSCEATPTSQCLWDIDCDTIGARCEMGQCETKPMCEAQIFEGNNLDGHSVIVGPVFYDDHQPYKIFNLADMEPSWGEGRVNSIKMSGGCGKIVKMASNDLNGADNFALTNHKGNSAKELKNMRGVNYLALYPKEWNVNPYSEWFANK